MLIDNAEKNFETSVLRFLDTHIFDLDYLKKTSFKDAKKKIQGRINTFFGTSLSHSYRNYNSLHSYSIFAEPNDKTEIREAYNAETSFLMEIADLPDDHLVKMAIQALFFESDDHPIDKIIYLNDKKEFVLGIPRYGEIPTYNYFCENITNLEYIKNSLFTVQKQIINANINRYIEHKINYNNRNYLYDYTYSESEPFYNGFYNANTQKITITENTKNIEYALRKLGFPYSATYQEYERFLDKNKIIAQLNYSQMDYDPNYRNTGRGCKFPASKIHKILWKAPIEKKDFITHTYVVARSGSGKSEFLKTLMREMGGHCILLDPHGDFANSLDGKKGFFKVAPKEKRFVINPFDITDKSLLNRELVAQEIKNLIEELMADKSISSLMTTVLKPVVQTLLKLPYADFAMLTACFNPISGGEKLDKLTPIVDETINNWDAILGDQYDTTKKSIFNRLVSFLNYSIVRDTVCGLDDFGDAIERVEHGGNLVISVPSPSLGEEVSEVLGRFFMCRMQIWAKSRGSIPEHLRTPVFLIVDECQNFLSEVTAKTLNEFGRKFGLFMVLAHQHIKQIDDTALKDSILTNCKNKIVGQASKATRQALASEMGLEQSDFEGLGRGYYWGTFENKGTIKFYSQMVKFKDTGDGVQYATSQNRAYVNGWDIVWDDIAPDTKTHAKPQEKTRKTPKYDV